MTITTDELQKIAALAYLEASPEEMTCLFHDIHAIMNYIEQLRQVETEHVEPLFHPLELPQRLRHDTMNESSHIEALAKVAPYFQDNLYLVPKVIDTGK